MYNSLQYKGYNGTIEYSKEDDYFFGKVTNLKKDAVTYEGKNLEELRKDFEGAIKSFRMRKYTASTSRTPLSDYSSSTTESR